MESLKNFVIDHVDRILEYLQTSPLVVYSRRTVDAYIASYALAETFAETAHVAITDWPPPSGICIGFKCNGFYIIEGEVGVEGKSFKAEYTSISHLTAVVTQSLAPMETKTLDALYVGHYTWSVDHCEYKCPTPRELSRGGEKLSIVFPQMETLEVALSLSTLPFIPGVTGRKIEAKHKDPIALLDWALGVVAAEGFHTAVLDKCIREYPGRFKPADIAQRLEATLAGFGDRDVGDYVSNLAEAFESVQRRAGEEVVEVHNPFYVYKIPPYLAYSLKLNNWAALRYGASKGVIVALVPPFKQREKLKQVAPALEELGQVLLFPTHVVLYLEPGEYPDFLQVYKRLRET